MRLSFGLLLFPYTYLFLLVVAGDCCTYFCWLVVGGYFVAIELGLGGVVVRVDFLPHYPLFSQVNFSSHLSKQIRKQAGSSQQLAQRRHRAVRHRQMDLVVVAVVSSPAEWSCSLRLQVSKASRLPECRCIFIHGPVKGAKLDGCTVNCFAHSVHAVSEANSRGR